LLGGQYGTTHSSILPPPKNILSQELLKIHANMKSALNVRKSPKFSRRMPLQEIGVEEDHNDVRF